VLEFLFDVPLVIVAPVLIVVMGCLSAGGLLVVRRRILPKLRITTADSEFCSTIVQSVMVFYGLAVALIAVTVWQTYSDTSRIVSQEATALGVLYRDVSTYPPPVRTELQDALREYVEYVIRDAWPAQRAGQIPRGGVTRVNRFQEILTVFEPSTEGQKILHAEMIRAYNRMLEARRMRLDAVQTGLPSVMWVVILVGAAIGLFGSYFFRVEDVRLHMILVVILSTFIAMVIFVVLAFDRPFRGDLGIGPESYQLIYDDLMKR
jgi:hypothetical protein